MILTPLLIEMQATIDHCTTLYIAEEAKKIYEFEEREPFGYRPISPFIYVRLHPDTAKYTGDADILKRLIIAVEIIKQNSYLNKQHG